MNKQTTRARARFLTHAGMIAAIYVALTYVSALFGLSGMGFFQLRLSEALTVLPYFTAAAVPGVTIGCLLANLLTGALWQDVLFGTLATLLGAIGTRLLKKHRYLATLPPILANTLIVPFVLRYAYVGVSESLPWLFLSVGVGELLSVGVLGTVLQLSLEKYRHILFPES